MNFLETKIQEEGRVLPGDVLLVDGFLNQGLDIDLLKQIGRAFYEGCDAPVDLVLTIEASGIALAVTTADAFGVNAAFVKKHASLNQTCDCYRGEVYSYTKQETYSISLARHLLLPGMRVFIVDDFLARGCALQGLIQLVEGAGATVAGIGVAIEKTFQEGGEKIRAQGYRLQTLAKIKSLQNGIVFD